VARLAFWSYLALLALAPLPLAGNRPAPANALCLAVGLLLILWAIAAWRRPELASAALRRWGWHIAAFFAFLGWALLQGSGVTPAAWDHSAWRLTGGPGAISVSPDDTAAATLRLAAYGGAFFLALQYGGSRRGARALLWTLALSAAAYAAYGVVAELTGGERVLWYRKWAYEGSLTATFVNRNAFATYAGIGLICALALLARATREAAQEALVRRDSAAGFLDQFAGRGWLAALAALILAVALAMTQSRAGVAAALAGVATLFALRIRLLDSRPARRALTAAAVVCVLFAGLAGGGALLQRLEADSGADLGARMNLYAAVLTGIAERPLLGAGYGAFEHGFLPYRGPELLYLRAIDKAHDSYLELAFEAGIPAALLLLGLVAAVAWRCVAGLRRSGRRSLYPAVALAVLAQTALHSLLDFSLQIPAVALAFSALLGLGAAQADQREAPAR